MWFSSKAHFLKEASESAGKTYKEYFIQTIHYTEGAAKYLQEMFLHNRILRVTFEQVISEISVFKMIVTYSQNIAYTSHLP